MLELNNIKKTYELGKKQDRNYQYVEALKSVSLSFRQNEFVSILGPSGCGKTTLLNIIGGLDQYSSGDLIINGKSTKQFSDKDWDTYRNHSIGFVFQSYNLIPHLNIFENVELALTLSGISKAERKNKVIDVLTKVGLKDRVYSKPNQLSGGQMQRVSIARALINNPDIILADEPTGALDSKTSVQIMNLLKEIAKEKLVIMVTHNPDLAEQYSTRLIKLLDGELIEDSKPFTDEEKKSTKNKDIQLIDKHKTKKRMSLLTALSLSFKNLLTKKARTILVSFAGSIGIIGIALILALSSGFQTYINNVQEETLTSYPITINKTSADYSALLESLNKQKEVFTDDLIHSNNQMLDLFKAMAPFMNNGGKENKLADFKKYIETDKENFDKISSTITYSYDYQLYVYNTNSEYTGVTRVEPNTVFDKAFGAMANGMSSYSFNVFDELVNNVNLLETQFDLVSGEWPKSNADGTFSKESYNEVVLMVDANGSISDYLLYALGLKNQKNLSIIMQNAIYGLNNELLPDKETFTYEEVLETNLKLVYSDLYYSDEDSDNIWEQYDESNKTQNELSEFVNINGETIKIVGIIKAKNDTLSLNGDSAIGYTSELISHIYDRNQETPPAVITAQKATPTINILDGDEFENTKNYENNLKNFGEIDLTNPSSINIYTDSFENKEAITKYINNYNNIVTADESKGESYKMTYTDYVGLLMGSITTILDAITYVLIAFVSVSLIVSSIMIGIITYISVLERIKEIGILRSIGASKRDIKRVFTAESVIIGFSAGLLGIIITLILCIPINIILQSLAGISGLAGLPFMGGLILILISTVLTFIAGLLPAKIASKKDPVIALRTE